MRQNVAPLVAAAILAAGLAPATAQAAESETTSHLESAERDTTTSSDGMSGDGMSSDGTPAVTPAETSTVAAGGTTDGTGGGAATATIQRDGAPVNFDTLAAAVADAKTGETITISGTHVLDAPITLADDRRLTIRTDEGATLVRGDGFPQQNGKVVGMIKLDGTSALALETAGGMLVLDGEDKDSNDAIVTINGQATFTMGAGTAIKRAHCSWKPWGAVYVRSGTFVLDGGELVESMAIRNTAVAVERAGTFELRSGRIAQNRATYSESIVWISGTMRMSGGTIAENRSNVSNDGVVQVLRGGLLEMSGGTVGDNQANNTFGIRVDDGGKLSLGGAARIEGSDRIHLAAEASLAFSSALTAHTTADPVTFVLAGTRAPASTVATGADAATVRDVLAKITAYAPSGDIVSLGIAADDPARIAVSTGEVAELFELLDRPYTTDLGLELKPAFLEPDAFATMRAQVEQHFSGLETPEQRHRMAQLDHIERYRDYLAANRATLEASIYTLSQIGDPGAEAKRTQQAFMFDNLDAPGLYLKPGQVNTITVFVEADRPETVSVAWRQVGLTDSSSYQALNLEQKQGLAAGENRITIDLTNKRYAMMLYLRNDDADNKVRVRVESTDAAAGGAPILGSSLGSHPVYVHDPARPERFWGYVQEVRAHAVRVDGEGAADMTMLQMGDEGHAQFAISATALAQAYQGITSLEEAVRYIERSNRAIQDRLAFFWHYDGYELGIEGANAVTTARVHTAFTRTVSSPSTMYAYGRYFHMPEDSAASFLSGDAMYGWAMSHEYGHCLDNAHISVAEETNNLYSIAGSRKDGIERSQAAGKAFAPADYYHPNAVRATKQWDEKLAKMAADPSYVPDWLDGGWGVYIWTHLTAWWNGLHFLSDWDYADYDFAASPFTPEQAADVKRFGAYGASMRILRSDAEAVATLQRLAPGSTSSAKYNRIAVTFTMGTGYNFAEYLHGLGERDLTEEVRAWCAQYPSMPRKVQYFSLDTDAAIINGARPYAGTVTPVVTARLAGDTAHITARMATDELDRATTAWELYRDGELVGFSRTGSFTQTGVDEEGLGAYTVVAYDVRLNPSEAAAVGEAPFTVEAPELTVGGEARALTVTGPAGASYAFEAVDPAIVGVDEAGMLTPRAAGATEVRVTMTWKGEVVGPFAFPVTVKPRNITLAVQDAHTYIGAALPAFSLALTGELLPGDAVGEARFTVHDAEGAAVDPTTPGTYTVRAEVADMGGNYVVKVVPGTLTVRQDTAEAGWVRREDAAGTAIASDAWTNTDVRAVALPTTTDAGTYDRIARAGTDAWSEAVTIGAEGVIEHAVALQVSDGAFAGAVSSTLAVTTRIDKTKPVTALEMVEDANKPTVRIAAHDVQPDGVAETSGVARIEIVVLTEDDKEVLREEVEAEERGHEPERGLARERDSEPELEPERELAYGLEHELELEPTEDLVVRAVTYDRAGNASEEAELRVEAPGEDTDGGPGGEDPGDDGSGGGDSGEGDAGDGSGEQPDDTPGTGGEDTPGGNDPDDTPGEDAPGGGAGGDTPGGSDDGATDNPSDPGDNPKPPANGTPESPDGGNGTGSDTPSSPDGDTPGQDAPNQGAGSGSTSSGGSTSGDQSSPGSGTSSASGSAAAGSPSAQNASSPSASGSASDAPHKQAGDAALDEEPETSDNVDKIDTETDEGELDGITSATSGKQVPALMHVVGAVAAIGATIAAAGAGIVWFRNRHDS